MNRLTVESTTRMLQVENTAKDSVSLIQKMSSSSSCISSRQLANLSKPVDTNNWVLSWRMYLEAASREAPSSVIPTTCISEFAIGTGGPMVTPFLGLSSHMRLVKSHRDTPSRKITSWTNPSMKHQLWTTIMLSFSNVNT
ncbi:hypothetical protein YC2023_091828 [Brassica napus]